MMVLRSSPKLGIFAVFAVALLLCHNNPYGVSAASGGRMGGSSFGREDHSSYSSYRSDSTSFGRFCQDKYFTRSAVGPVDSTDDADDDASVIFLLFIVIVVLVVAYILTPTISILKLQVAFSAEAPYLQRELTEIAFRTDTSCKHGWHSILGETTSLLLGHPDYYYLYGYSSVTSSKSFNCKWEFEQLSKKERKKCNVESVVNVRGFTKQRAVPKAENVNKDCIVVTILAAVEGDHKLPTIRTPNDAKRALRHLRKISSCCCNTKALEVLWTPQDETDSLSVEEFLIKYDLPALYLKMEVPDFWPGKRSADTKTVA